LDRPTAKPDRSEPSNWFLANTGPDSKREIYIIVSDEADVGYIYIDPITADQFELFISVREQDCGKHIGRETIKKIIAQYRKANPTAQFIAWIREDGLSSLKAFTNANFKPTGDYSWRFRSTQGKTVKIHKYINEP
jgi:hypothetical protein